MIEFDWRDYVREKIVQKLSQSVHGEELIEELAGFLEDAYTAALQRGFSRDEALALAQQQVADWHRLARKIRQAEPQEDPMSHVAKALWFPGTAMLVLAAIMLLFMARLVPPAIWIDRPVLMIAPWLCSYFLFGALGAWWSRRARGSVGLRFFSGTFPVALHLAIFILPIMVALASDAPKFPEHRQLGWLLRTSVTWIVIPAAALAMGTLPFLKDSSEKSVLSSS